MLSCLPLCCSWCYHQMAQACKNRLTQRMMNFPLFQITMKMMLMLMKMKMKIVEFVFSHSLRGGADSRTGLHPLQLIPRITSRGQ